MIKAIFFDIDGTLITSNNYVLKSTKQSLIELKKQGYIIGIATSRGPSMLPTAVKRLPFDYWVMFNGQLIYDKDKKAIYRHPLDEYDLNQIKRYARKQKSRYLLQTEFHHYGSAMMKVAQNEWVLPGVHFMKKYIDEEWIQSAHRLRLLIPDGKNYQAHDEAVYQVTMMQPKQLDQRLKKQITSLTITRSNPFTVEIVSANISKSNGIRKALLRDHLSLDHVLFFGDNYNDMEVMEKVKYGVAMGNAIPALQKKASYVTTANNKDGIYHALCHFGLIKRREK